MIDLKEVDRVIKEWDDWMDEHNALLNSIDRSRRQQAKK